MHRVPDIVANGVYRPGGVDDAPAVGFLVGEGEETQADSLVELGWFFLELHSLGVSVDGVGGLRGIQGHLELESAHTRDSDLRRAVQQEREIRHDTVGCQRVDGLDGLDIDPPAVALIGDGGIGVTVGDDDEFGVDLLGAITFVTSSERAAANRKSSAARDIA